MSEPSALQNEPLPRRRSALALLDTVPELASHLTFIRGEVRMRVCDINNLYSPTGGGVRTYLERKLRYYRERGDTPYGLMVPSLTPQHSVEGVCERYDLPALRLGSSGYALTVSPKAVRQAMRQFKPDVVEVGSAYVLPALVHAALRDRELRQPRRAVIGFVHAIYPNTYVEAPLTNLVGPKVGKMAAAVADQHMRLTYNSFDATFVASQVVQENLEGIGVRNVYRTPLGFDASRFSPSLRSEEARARWGAGPKDKLVIFVGRISLEKSVDFLMSEFPELRKIPGVKTVVVGHGPLEDEVRVVSERHGGMMLTGFMTDQKALAELYASADVMLSMGRFETFSLAALEAQASGTPVVAVNEGAAAELVRNSGVGAVYQHGERGALVEAIRSTLDTPQAARDQLAEWAKNTFSWDACFNLMHQRYEETVERVRREG